MAIDWSKYAVGGAAARPDSFSKLNPDYAARVAQLIQAADQELGPGSLKITSAYRSPELQAQLFAGAVKKYGSEAAARKWVAPPGRSKHNAGLAVDFADASGRMLRDANSREAQWIKANAARFGLDVPMSWEPWQVELSGSRGGAAPALLSTSGGGGSTTLAGGDAGDDLDIDFEAFGASAQEPAAPEAPAVPAATVAEDYAASGALNEIQLDDLTIDLSGFAPMAAPQGIDAATGQQMAMTPPRAEDAFTPTPQGPSNIRGQLSRPGMQAAGQFAEQAAGFGPVSPSNIPGMIASLPSRAGQALTGISGALGYGIGGAADVAVAAGVDPGIAQRMARDVMAMPDAFAGSPQQASRIATAPRVAGQADNAVTPVAGRIEPPVTRPAPAPSMEDVQNLMVRAQGRGKTSRDAMRELARQAKVNPETAAAAERLGIDLPVDVYSESIAIQEAAGAIRGIKTGEAAADFLESVKTAQGRADEIMSRLDGGTSISDVSENVMASLRGTQATLKSSATELYQAVDAKVPKATPVQASRTSAILSETMSDLGGLSRMTPQEQTLVKAITNAEEPLTYAGLVRLKQDIGRALERGQGPYADVNQATLKRLYGGLAEDQIETVRAIGGDDLVKGLENANNLTAQRKDLEKAIVGAFGKDLEGSIATKLRTSVAQGAKGDIGGLNRILNVIPPELRKEAVASAISDLASKTRGAERGPFSFEQFANVYQGLRAQPPVYSKVVDVLGKDGHALMEDLYRVSVAVSRARAAIPMTGKANQITQSGALGAEGLISRVLGSTAGRTAVRAGTTGAFGMAGGVPGAIAADAVGAALTKGKPDRIQAAGKLLSSDQFRKLAIEAATMPAVSERSQRAVLASPEFRRFSKTASIDNPEAWLKAAIAGNITAQTANEGAE